MMRKLSPVLLLCFLTACASPAAKKTASSTGAPGQPKIVVPTAEPISITKDLTARAVTSLGDNRAARFSADGSHLLFLSSARPSHRQAQVYDLELLRMTERRVTFHDGDDEGVSWAGASKIVYSSVTDEIKETVSLDRIKQVYEDSKSFDNPNGIRPPPKIVNGGEIYMQRLDGRDIDRLTDSAGPDTSPTSDGRRVVFVSSRSGDSKLYLWTGNASVRAISHGPDFAPALSPDGRSLVWQRLVPQTDPKAPQQFQLMISENMRDAVPLTGPGFIDQQPQWAAKGDAVIFSSNRGNGKSFDLFTIDRKGSCLKRLTEVQADLTWPTASPDGSKIAFTARSSGLSQIYLMDDRSNSLSCLSKP